MSRCKHMKQQRTRKITLEGKHQPPRVGGNKTPDQFVEEKAGKFVTSFGKELVTALDDPATSEDMRQQGENVGDVAAKWLHNFNEGMKTPELRQEASVALNNVMEALDKPLDKAVTKLGEVSGKAIKGLGSGVVEMGSSALSAIPGVGAVVALGKTIDNISHAAESVTHTIAEASDTLQELVKDTKQAMQESKQILHRTDQSIATFQKKPESVEVTGGGKKMRYKTPMRSRWLLRNKYRTRKVRFQL